MTCDVIFANQKSHINMPDSESNSSVSTYRESTDSFSDEDGENLYGCYEKELYILKLN